MKKGNFQYTIERIDRMLAKAKDISETVKILCEKGDMTEASEEAFRLEEITEKTVLLTRALPAYTGYPRAKSEVNHIIRETVPIEIGYTEEGWFSLRMPTLLPKKSSGSADYIRQMLYPAMQRFFKGKIPYKYDEATIVFRHVYSEERPDRQARDHDNIETNMVADIVAMFVLVDDSPKHCSHFYLSSVGDADRTEVYVVPKGELCAFLKSEENMSKEGEKLYETRF